MKDKWLLMSLLVCCMIGSAYTQTMIWSQCDNSGVYCAQLWLAPPCGLSFQFYLSHIKIYDKPLNLAVSNEVCQTLGGCDYCLALENITKTADTVNACVYLENSCSNSNMNLGCFSNAALLQCVTTGCPNGCSGHGTCGADNVCACNLGWTGSDCSQNQLVYNQCINVPSYGNLCLNLEFESCAIDASLTMGIIPLYSQTIMAPDFSTYFTEASCVTPLGCSACLYWENYVLNTTYASGCPHFNLTCAGQPMGDYAFNCFADTSLVPACFAACPLNCSNRGTCNDQHECNCNAGYSGNTCELISCAQVNECSTHGTCVSPNTCKCVNGWYMDDCSLAKCDQLNNCSGHGNCISPNKCSCSAGYTGDSCQSVTCPNTCNNNGSCVNGQCQCTGDWTGSDCSTKNSQSYSPALYLGIGLCGGVVVAVGGGVLGFVAWRRERAKRTGVFQAFDDGLLAVPDTDQ